MSALSQWQEGKQEKNQRCWFVHGAVDGLFLLYFQYFEVHISMWIFYLACWSCPWTLDPWVNAGWDQLNNGSWRCLPPNPRNLQRLPYMVKGYFADMTKVKILRWEGYPELSQWALNIIISILWGRQQGHKQQWEVLQQSRGWNDGGMGFQKLERQGNRFSPRVSRRNLAQHLDFSPGKLISGFWPLEKKFVLS